jgi:putative ATP-binding cassette transporter
MDHLVKFKDGAFTDTSLSTGQRKRLALIAAILRGKQIILLDEWACEQDQAFRAKFYTEILPLLKERGLTVIVVTHDEEYFGVGDSLLCMEDGLVAPAGLC